MSAKMGRPKSQSPKCIRYSIRLDETTEARLNEFCKQRGITKGEAIRMAILNMLYLSSS